MVRCGRSGQRSFQALSPMGHLAHPAPPPHALCSQLGEEDGRVCEFVHSAVPVREAARVGGRVGLIDRFGVGAPSYSRSPGLDSSSTPTPPLCCKDRGLQPEGLLGAKPFAYTSTAVQQWFPRARRDLPRSHSEDTQSHMARSSKVI